MNELLDQSYDLLRQAQESLEAKDKGSAVSLLEMAVRRALTALEKANGVRNFGMSLEHRIAHFTDDPQLINIGRVIEDLFNPILYPVGFDQGTEEPRVSFGQAQMALEYARRVIDFVREKLENGTEPAE